MTPNGAAPLSATTLQSFARHPARVATNPHGPPA